MMQAVNISKKFQKISILSDINITLPKNRIVALTGQNAIGKTVLLECLSGYKKLSSGQITFDGKAAKEEEKRQNIVYQKKGVFFTPKTTIASALQSFRILFPNYNAEQAVNLLGKWNIPLWQTWADLSIGQQQKAEFSLFISRAAAFYFFDEPFANLDYSAHQELKKYFLQYLPEDSTCVISINNFAGMDGFFTDLWVLKEANELIAVDLVDTNNSGDLLELYEEAIGCHV